MGQLILINEARLAKQFLITERQVRSLFKEYKCAPGEYLYTKCVKKYISQLKTRKGDESEETEKLKKIKRETQEFKLKILKDEYHSEEIIRDLLADIFIKFRSQLLSSSRKIAVEIEQTEDGNTKEIVEKHILKVLEELNRYNPPSNKGDR